LRSGSRKSGRGSRRCGQWLRASRRTRPLVRCRADLELERHRRQYPLAHETAIVLEKGLTIGGKPPKAHLEAIGHQDALAYVRALTAETRPIRETDIREIR
jgi:hypothetical protein